MLQLLTATGARPEAFALCQRWMSRQNYAGEIRWLIVDDGEQPQRISADFRANWELWHLRRKPHWTPGQNTQAANLLHGLREIDREHPVVVIEDDDWYAPDWLTHVSEQLRHAELVGEKRARYYNVAGRTGRQLHNESHASLCATAMRGAVIGEFVAACESAPKFIDLQLWKSRAAKHLLDGHRVVGIKGLPGRAGIGMGHSSELQGQQDPHGALLRQWIGEDADAYLNT